MQLQPPDLKYFTPETDKIIPENLHPQKKSYICKIFSPYSLRRSVCILLLLIIAVQSFNKRLVTISFKLNEQYISSVLCENKNKPEMHCNGRCILAKKLKQAEENEQKQRDQNQESTNVLFFCKLHRLKLANCLSALQKASFNSFYLRFRPSPSYNDIFKPPQAQIA